MSEGLALSGVPLGHLPITNTWLTSIVVMLVLIVVGYKATSRMSLVPSGWQNLLELILETFYNLVESVTQSSTKAHLFFPLVATFFLYILTSNYVGLLPGVGTIGYYAGHTFVSFLRSPASDLNLTLTLALFSVVATHVYAIRELGVKGYLAIWFSLNPILLFVGLLEIISEFTKVISLAFRLFGNIYAGEIVLETVSSKISPFLVTIPFYSLELIVGFVQALVFAMLTLASLVLLTSHHGDESHSSAV